MSVPGIRHGPLGATIETRSRAAHRGRDDDLDCPKATGAEGQGEHERYAQMWRLQPHPTGTAANPPLRIRRDRMDGGKPAAGTRRALSLATSGDWP